MKKTLRQRTSHNSNHLLSLFFLFLTLVRCSSPQRPELPLRPNPYTVDVATIPITIDHDAYTSIQLTPSDAGFGFGGGGDSGELLAPLRRGQVAPFPGVLLNGPALARVEVEFRAQDTMCRINRQAELDRLAARALADIQLIQTSLNAQTQSYVLMLSSRDQEIDRLYRWIQANPPQGVPVMPVVLGTLGGILVGAGVGALLGVTLGR